VPNGIHDSGAGEEVSRTVMSSAQSGLLDRDIACPGCAYNLRGLGAGDVVCPECGLASNVPRLLTRRWDKPWYRAPGYNKLCLPAAWLVASLLLLVVLSILNALTRGQYWAAFFAGWGLVTAAVWVGLLVWVWRSMAGLASAGYALLSHVALGGYLVGVPLFIGGFAWAIAWVVDVFSQRPMAGKQHGLSVVLLLGGFVLFVFGRWIERVVAGHCIRLYLRRSSS